MSLLKFALLGLLLLEGCATSRITMPSLCVPVQPTAMICPSGTIPAEQTLHYQCGVDTELEPFWERFSK